MNLFYMLERKDRNATFSEGCIRSLERVQGEAWRGVTMSPGAAFRVPHAQKHHSLRSRPDTCGWFAVLPVDGPDLEVGFETKDGERLSTTRLAAGSAGMISVRLPWPQRDIPELDLVVRAVPTATGGSAPLFLAVHRALDRRSFLGLAKGAGVEIGPGANPQILPSEGVEIRYLEQMHPEKWNALYNQNGKYATRPELWDNYIVGDAANLPCEDESLDFIFSSHVFEHLSNPLGHLKRWRRKLKPGGRVLCIVPDLGGSKDYFKRPSHLPELAEEFAHETWEPTQAHYVRHMERAPDDAVLRQAMSDRQSIHVHYYTNTNCEELLDYARLSLGFSSFSMTWTPNHKDFYFSLTRA